MTGQQTGEMRAHRPVPSWDRSRLGILAAYVFNGFALAAWSVRLPGIQSGLGIDATQVGLFLTAGALGTLMTIAAAGTLVARWGAKRCYELATACFVAAYALMAAALIAGWYPLLMIGGAFHGAAFALTNIPQSILSAARERQAGRTILPQFHAGYSIGAALGAAAGGFAAGAGLSPAGQFAALAVLALVIRSVAARLMGGLDQQMHHAHAEAQLIEQEVLTDTAGIPLPPPRWRARLGLEVWRDGQVIAIGVLLVAAAIAESSANNWAAIALVDSFDITEAASALALTVFLVAQTVVRLAGGPVIDRIGRAATLRVSFGVAAAGVLVFILAPSMAGAVVGTALWGAGSALVVPIAIALAAADPRRGPARVAAVTSLSSLANIAGPPLVGALGGLVGVRYALSVVTAGSLIALCFVRRAAVRRAS